MPASCLVKGCRGKDKNGKFYSRFKFPKDEILQSKWMKAINVHLEKVKLHHKVCIQHFKPEDIQTTTRYFDVRSGRLLEAKINTPRLVEGSIPIQILPNAKINPQPKPKYYRQVTKRKTRKKNADELVKTTTKQNNLETVKQEEIEDSSNFNMATTTVNMNEDSKEDVSSTLSFTAEEIYIKEEVVDEPEETIFIKKEPDLNIFENINSPTNNSDVEVVTNIFDDRVEESQLTEQSQILKSLLKKEFIIECDPLSCSSSVDSQPAAEAQSSYSGEGTSTENKIDSSNEDISSASSFSGVEIYIKEEVLDEPEEKKLNKKEPAANIFEYINTTTNNCDVEMQTKIIDDKAEANQLLVLKPSLVIECDSSRYSSSFIYAPGAEKQGTDFIEDVFCQPPSYNNSLELNQQVKEKKFMCDHCQYKTDISGNLKKHMVTHTGERNFICNLCDYKATRSNDLRSHLKIHTGERDFPCNLCDYKATRHSNLKYHMKSHMGEKNYHCKLCDYKAVQKSTLNTHMKTHTGEKNFQCNLCDYKTKRCSHLKSHMKTHTGEKNFHCDLCDFKATNSGNLKYHMRTHTGEKNFHCNLCDYKASRNSTVIRHKKRQHKVIPD